MADDDQLARLKAGIAEWNQWREENPTVEIDLRGIDLSEADLSKADLSGANLSEADFHGANLSRANLIRANLSRANLSMANLSEADLARVDLTEAMLWLADLSGTWFSEANLSGAKLWETNLSEADLVSANLTGAVLWHADLSKADLTAANLSEADLSRTNLSGATLNGANLSEADLSFANLSGALLGGADLPGANLKEANLSRANFVQADLSRANLREADLADVDLRDVKGLKLDGQFIRDARFSAQPKKWWSVFPFTAQSLDPWSILRRTYTGPRLLFNFLFLAAFLLPNVAKVVFWSFVNRTQDTNQAMLANIRQRAQEQGVTNDQISRMGLNDTSNLTSCLSPPCESLPVWQLMLGLDQGLVFFILAILLIVYNAMKGVMTFLIEPMREEEVRSGYAPAWGEWWWQGYRVFYYTHQLVKVLFFVSIAASLFNACHWLGQPVYVPTVPS